MTHINTKLVPHVPEWFKRFTAWLFALAHDDELNEVSFYVRYKLECPPATAKQATPDTVRQLRDDRLRALGAMDVMSRLGLGGR